MPDQSKLLAKLKEMVDLLETNTVTSPETLKKIASGVRLMPMAEIPNGTRHTFDAMPKELKWLVLKHLETTELLVVAQVSQECTSLVKKIVEMRDKKMKEDVELGRNIWGEEDGMSVKQIEALLGSLAHLKLRVGLRLSGADVDGLVKKVGLKLFLKAVLGVSRAHVEMKSSDHVRELLDSMGRRNMQLKGLILSIPHQILEQLPEALFINLGKLTGVGIWLDQQSLNLGGDFTKVMMALAANPFKKIKYLSLFGGSFGEGADSVKIANSIVSLDMFQYTTLGHFSHYGELLHALAQPNSKLFKLEIDSLDLNFILDQVDIETMVTALTNLQSFSLEVVCRSEAHIGALEGIPEVSVERKLPSDRICVRKGIPE